MPTKRLIQFGASLMKPPVRIFLSYARNDLKKVEKLYKRLSDEGYKPWMDKMDILPGEEWESSIEKAIKRADFFLPCLTPTSINKEGFFQKEIKIALKILQEKLDGRTFIIPVRFEECEIPDTLSKFQWVNYHKKNGHAMLLQAISTHVGRRVEQDNTTARKVKTLKRSLVDRRKLKKSRLVKSQTTRGNYLEEKNASSRNKKENIDILTMRSLALYQTVDVLIFQVKNKARDIVRQLDHKYNRLPRINLAELDRLNGELAALLRNEAKDLSLFSWFDLIHIYKTMTVTFFAAVSEIWNASRLSKPEIQVQYKVLEDASHVVMKAISKKLKQKRWMETYLKYRGK